MQYIILKCDSRDDLAHDVIELISEGWTPQGGVAVVAFEDDLLFYQAMIRQPNNGPTTI